MTVTGSQRVSTDIRRILMVMAAVSMPSVAFAEPKQSEWWEGRFLPMSQQTFDIDGVKISSCHIEFFDMGQLNMIPKCYVFNSSDKTADVRIDFVVNNPKGETISAVVLTYGGLNDMHGSELSQMVPVTKDEVMGTKTGKVRVWVKLR